MSQLRVGGPGQKQYSTGISLIFSPPLLRTTAPLQHTTCFTRPPALIPLFTLNRKEGKKKKKKSSTATVGSRRRCLYRYRYEVKMEESWVPIWRSNTISGRGGSMIPRRHSTDQELYQLPDGHHPLSSSSSRSRSRRDRLVAADNHHHHSFRSSNSTDEEDHEDHQRQCQRTNNHQPQPAMGLDGHQLDFCDVFGGPPRSTTTNNILLRRHFSGDFGTTAPACTAAGISSGVTNFYDEIFCRHPGSHCRHHCISDHPNPGSKQGGGSRCSSVRPAADCSELHYRMRNRRISGSRSSIREGGGRYLPGFSIPSSSSSSCMTQENTSTPAGAAGLLVQTEEGFYDDIFGSCSNMNGNGGRSSRTCTCFTCRSSIKSFKSKSKSGSKSKSKASCGSSTISVLSSDQDIELIMPGAYNHHREEEQQDDQDAVLDSFASKLRPITIPRRSRASGYDECDPSAPSTVLVSAGVVRDTKEEDDKDDDVEVSSNRTSTTFMGLSSSASSLLQQPLPPSDHHAKGSPFDASSFPHYYCYHQQRRPGFCPSPDHHQTTLANSKITLISEMYDFAPGSPVSSVVSSLYLEPLPRNAVQAHTQRSTAENKAAAEERGGEIVASIAGDESDKESERSLIIKLIEDDDEYGGEYCSRRRREMRETEGATAVDEAIAWAKEKFCSGSSAAAAAGSNK